MAARATGEPGVAPVARLRCVRGSDTLTAVTVLLEVFDCRRFASPRPRMRCVGLVPSEASSGGSHHRRSLTKTGNAPLRRVLGAAAWHAQHRPGRNPSVRTRRQGQPPAVVAIAEQAERRLHRKFVGLVLRGKPRTVAATAVARELCGFLWAARVTA